MRRCGWRAGRDCCWQGTRKVCSRHLVLVSPLEQVIVGHDNSGVGPRWFLEKVHVHVYVCVCVCMCVCIGGGR